MEEEKKDNSKEEIKSPWQLKKESWYDKVPLTLKQLDIIIGVCWTLLGLFAVAVALDCLGIANIF